MSRIATSGVKSLDGFERARTVERDEDLVTD